VYRARPLKGTPRGTGRTSGDAVGDDFDKFWDQLAIPSAYAMIHVGIVVIAMLKQASYSMPPTMHPQEKLYQVQRKSMASFARNNPLVQMLYQASDDDFFEFTRLQIQGIDNWQNFGRVTLEQPTANHLMIHYDDFPNVLLGPGLRALYEGALELFTRPATTSLEIHDETHATMHVERH